LAPTLQNCEKWPNNGVIGSLLNPKVEVDVMAGVQGAEQARPARQRRGAADFFACLRAIGVSESCVDESPGWR